LRDIHSDGYSHSHGRLSVNCLDISQPILASYSVPLSIHYFLLPHTFQLYFLQPTPTGKVSMIAPDEYYMDTSTKCARHDWVCTWSCGQTSCVLHLCACTCLPLASAICLCSMRTQPAAPGPDQSPIGSGSGGSWVVRRRALNRCKWANVSPTGCMPPMQLLSRLETHSVGSSSTYIYLHTSIRPQPTVVLVWLY
jgi:hypothetical protein